MLIVDWNHFNAIYNITVLYHQMLYTQLISLKPLLIAV